MKELSPVSLCLQFLLVIIFITSVLTAEAAVYYSADLESRTCDTDIEDETVDGALWDTYQGPTAYPLPYVRCSLDTPSGSKYVEWQTICLQYSNNRCSPGNDPDIGTTDAGVQIDSGINTITLSSGSEYCIGSFVRFDKVSNRDIWVDTSTANSFDKLLEMSGSGFRWGIGSGWPNGNHTAVDGKFTFDAWCADSVFEDCQTTGNPDHKTQNANGYSSSNPFLADYGRWYAVAMCVVANTSSSGRVRLWVNGTAIIDQNLITSGTSPTIEHIFINGTIGQGGSPPYDTPEHLRYMDGLMLASSLDDLANAGLMSDPELPSWCAEEEDTISRSYTTVSGTNSALVVFVPYYNGSGTRRVSSVSWGATTLSRVSGTSGTTPGDYAAEIWVAPLGASHTGATNTLTVTFDSSSLYGCAVVRQFDGIHQTTPAHDGTATNNTQENGTASLTVSNVVSTDIVIGAFIKKDGSMAYTPGGNQTALAEFQIPNLTDRRALIASKSGLNGGTISATFGSTYHGGAAAALKSASPILPVGTTDTEGCVDGGDTISRSYTTVSGTNSALVVFLPYYNSPATRKVSTVSWGATSLTRISGTSGTVPGDQAAEIWIAPLGASYTAATNTLTVTFTSSSVYGCAVIQQFDGIDQSTPAHDGTATDDTQESGTATFTVSNVASTDVVIAAFIKADGSGAYTLGGSQISLAEFQIPDLTSRRLLSTYKSGLNGGTISATFGSTYHGGAAAALKPAS